MMDVAVIGIGWCLLFVLAVDSLTKSAKLTLALFAECNWVVFDAIYLEWIQKWLISICGVDDFCGNLELIVAVLISWK